MLSIVMLNVIMLNVILLNVIMLNVIMLNVIMLNVIMLNVIMLSAVVPPINWKGIFWIAITQRCAVLLYKLQMFAIIKHSSLFQQSVVNRAKRFIKLDP